MFRNTGANAFAKNQMRLAYEDKRDLYCTCMISEYNDDKTLKFLNTMRRSGVVDWGGGGGGVLL